MNGLRKCFTRGLAFVLILQIVASSSVQAAPSRTCVTLLQDRFLSQSIDVRKVDHLPLRNHLIPRSAMFPNSDEVLFGIKDGDSGHAYLVVGNTRYDGNISPAPVKVKHGVKTLSPGILFRFRGISPESMAMVQNHFKTLSDGKSTSLTCHHGACEELAAGGLALAGTARSERASDLVRRIVENGFVDSTGAPVRVEIYQTGPARLEDAYKNIRWRETKHLYGTWFYLGAAGGFVSLLFLTTLLEDKKPNAKAVIDVGTEAEPETDGKQ